MQKGHLVKMKDGFIRVAAATPEIKVADCGYNSENIISLIKEANDNNCSVVVFPELCITGYTCGDLFLHKTLIDGAENALRKIVEITDDFDIVTIVGLPFIPDKSIGNLYNCAAVIQRGKILGFVPKYNIPNYSEFYEARHFSAGYNAPPFVTFDGNNIKFGSLVFKCRNIPEFRIGVEICEDLWVVNPPSNKLALDGATVICNLSASDEVIGKADYRRNLVKSQSARIVSTYIYCDAGFGESTTDMIFSGHNIICENGTTLKESKKFSTGLIFIETDLAKLCGDRIKTTTFNCVEKKRPEEDNDVYFEITEKQLKLTRYFPKSPFVPSNKDDLSKRCDDIITMQATGLATRLKHINCKNVVIGLSGGLDSTLALIVCVHAFDMLGLDRKGIKTVTMPCFGTTSRTKNNAHLLAEAYGTELTEIDIGKAVQVHFEDIGQSMDVHDVTFENGQARERTQVLMDLSNKYGGIVIGTGDLSELALGWATYNGDHMSMYGVNGSIPKTLVKYLVRHEGMNCDDKTLKSVLEDILDTPVSPELLPPENGEISQKTEDIVGPYELHDFFLYYFLRTAFSPSKILRLAEYAFDGLYESGTIKKWLTVFIKRFFSQQFKRSCLPDGPKVGTVTLSPRGDFRMPSDAVVQLWLDDLSK